MSVHAYATELWKLTHGGAGNRTVSRNRVAGGPFSRAPQKAKHNNPLDKGLRLRPEAILRPLFLEGSHRILADVDYDLFHPRVPPAYQSLAWETMALAKWHTFIFVTRYPTVQRTTAGLFNRHHPPNVWLGVQVENRAQLQPRLEELRHTPAAVRFLSFDPLVERLGALDLEGIDWVIVAGEASPRARPIHPEWVKSIRDQCLVADVPFCFKSWGGYGAARVLDGRLWDDRPLLKHGMPPSIHRRRNLLCEVRRAAAYMFPPDVLAYCPLCRCCTMVSETCTDCHGSGEIGGKGVPAEYHGLCLRCRGSGDIPKCSGSCRPFKHHGETEQLQLFKAKKRGGRYATSGF